MKKTSIIIAVMLSGIALAILLPAVRRAAGQRQRSQRMALARDIAQKMKEWAMNHDDHFPMSFTNEDFLATLSPAAGDLIRNNHTTIADGRATDLTSPSRAVLFTIQLPDGQIVERIDGSVCWEEMESNQPSEGTR